MEKFHVLKQTTVINKPINEVFDFFCKAENLNKISPPDLHFTIVTPLPIEMKVGRLIDYKIKLGIIPLKWQTEITEWNPPNSFADMQIKGPYKLWLHTHSFVAKENATEMTDVVKYLSRGWFLEPLIDKLYVRKKVEEIFAYRNKQIEILFA